MILIEGRTMIADHDLVRAVGTARPEARRFDVEVADGFLDIELVPKRMDPMISAIEIELE